MSAAPQCSTESAVRDFVDALICARAHVDLPIAALFRCLGPLLGPIFDPADGALQLSPCGAARHPCGRLAHAGAYRSLLGLGPECTLDFPAAFTADYLLVVEDAACAARVTFAVGAPTYTDHGAPLSVHAIILDPGRVVLCTRRGQRELD